MANYKYYLIYKETIIRTYEKEKTIIAEKYTNGTWTEVDYYKEIYCKLIGFDSSEDDWMYGIGNTDIMDSIEEISEEKCNTLIKEQTCN